MSKIITAAQENTMLIFVVCTHVYLKSIITIIIIICAILQQVYYTCKSMIPEIAITLILAIKGQVYTHLGKRTLAWKLDIKLGNSLASQPLLRKE